VRAVPAQLRVYPTAGPAPTTLTAVATTVTAAASVSPPQEVQPTYPAYVLMPQGAATISTSPACRSAPSLTPSSFQSVLPCVQTTGLNTTVEGASTIHRCAHRADSQGRVLTRIASFSDNRGRGKGWVHTSGVRPSLVLSTHIRRRKIPRRSDAVSCIDSRSRVMGGPLAALADGRFHCSSSTRSSDREPSRLIRDHQPPLFLRSLPLLLWVGFPNV
jgi:hypothetical protein